MHCEKAIFHAKLVVIYKTLNSIGTINQLQLIKLIKNLFRIRNDLINDRDYYHHYLNLTKEQIDELRKYQCLLDDGKKRFKDIIKRLYFIRKDIAEARVQLSQHPAHIVPILKHDQVVSCYAN